MIKQIDSMWWLKLNGLIRSYIAHGGLTPLVPIYIVTEHQKSGGTWLSQLITTSLNIPFPRNRLPPLGSCLLHGQFRNKWNMKKPVILWRDGRDVIVSEYFYHIVADVTSHGYPAEVRKKLNYSDPHDIENNLPHFIEYAMNQKLHSHHTWPSFVDYWHGTPGAIETSYEALREDTLKELTRIVEQLTKKNNIDKNILIDTIEKFSFKNQTTRKAGQEDRKSFLRKGVVGDWKNNFSSEASTIFDFHAGEQLIKLGYEKDHSWAEHKNHDNKSFIKLVRQS